MNDTFIKKRLKLILENSVSVFIRHFGSLGYTEVPPVPISSGVDPTVRFIGSHISVLKPYFLNNKPMDSGYFIVQNCIRTHNLYKLFNDEALPNWGSFFPSFGVIVPEESLSTLIVESLSFIKTAFFITDKDIKIRISSKDEKFVDTCKMLGLQSLFEIDSQPIKYYRHTLGNKGIIGKNFNIALLNKKTKVFEDVGNIIIIEQDSCVLCVELALGETTMIKAVYGLDHVLDCHPIKGLDDIENKLKIKFQDAILTSLVLFREGLRPNGSSNQGRILRTYARSLSYFRKKLNINLSTLNKILMEFEAEEFNISADFVSKEIIKYLKIFEMSLKNKKTMSQEEKIVFNTIKIE